MKRYTLDDPRRTGGKSRRRRRRFANSLQEQQYDAAQTRLREVLTDLEGVSDETLEQIERLSRPSGDGRAPHDEGVVTLYERLVMLALAENAWRGSRRAWRRRGKQANPSVVGVASPQGRRGALP